MARKSVSRSGRSGAEESCIADCSLEGNRDGGVPAIAGPRPPVSLPCQSSNNSIETDSKLSPYQRKNAFILKENLEAAIERFGIERIGFLTLTFPKDLTLKQANARFNSLATNVLNDLLECWVCVREFTGRGRPHFHLVVICKGDIREGFNFENYLQMARMSRPATRRKYAREIKALSRSLNPSPHLRSVWEALRRALPRYGFGRHELIPIRKPDRIAFYVGGYIRKSMEKRPVSAKGARLVTYSKDYERRVNGHAWQWNTDGAHIWRRKLEAFARYHRIRDFEGLSKRYGPRWAFWLRDVIESLNLRAFVSVSFDLRSKEIEVMDMVRFSESLDVPGFSLVKSMHLYAPRIPVDGDGKPFTPPRSLQSLFALHLNGWHLTPDGAKSFRSCSAPCRFSLSREGLTNRIPEQLEADRARLLQPTSSPWEPEDFNDPWWHEFLPPHLLHAHLRSFQEASEGQERQGPATGYRGASFDVGVDG